MVSFILGLLLAAVAIVCWALLKTYQHVPLRELKRLARRGDGTAQAFYRAVAYGSDLTALLVGVAVVCEVFSLVVFASAVGLWAAIGILLLLMAVGAFLFVPGDELRQTHLFLAQRLAPAIAWALERLHPLLDSGVRAFHRYRHVHVHTGLYEKDDLVQLLEQQKGQADSRIDPGEVELLQHALTFGDKLVVDALVPLRVVKTVAASESVGPVLMDELSKSGHSRFPVYDGKHNHIVGILYLHDLVGIRGGGKVSDVMSRKLTYVHEDFSLHEALQAFLKTKRHLFLVINSFEELAGILTIEDVLEQMIGSPIVDEFDRYDDLRAVAAVAAQKEHARHQKDKTEPEPEPEPPTEEA